jgi:membrane protein
MVIDAFEDWRHSWFMLVFLQVLRGVFRVLSGAMSDFQRHGCGSLAASLAYFALLSFFPLVFLLLYLVGFFVSQDRIGHDFLLSFLQNFLPTVGADFALEIKRVASEQVARWVVFLTFIWFGLLVFYEVDYTINVVFETVHERHALVSTLISVILLGLVGVLLVLSYGVSQMMAVLVTYAPRIAGIDMLAVAAHDILITYVLPFAVVAMAVTALYRYLPRRHPQWRDALVGGIVLTLLWELAKHLFRVYIQELTIYGRMYGSFLAIILFLIWVYYSAALFLFGAAVVHRLQARHLPAASP